MNIGDSMLAKGAFEFVYAHMFFGQVRCNRLSIMSKEAGLAQDDPPESAAGAGEARDQIIQIDSTEATITLLAGEVSGPVMASCTEFDMS